MKKLILVTLVLFYISGNNFSQKLERFENAGYNANNGLVNNNEPSAAINPTNSSKIVIASNYRELDQNHSSFTERAIGIYYSTDRGYSWSFKKILPITGYNKLTDPSLAFNTAGELFCSYLGLYEMNSNRKEDMKYSSMQADYQAEFISTEYQRMSFRRAGR